MAKPLQKIIDNSNRLAILRRFLRVEVAQKLGAGFRHIHCSQMGNRDPLYAVTYKAVQSGTVPEYVWERSSSNPLHLNCPASGRHKVSQELLSSLHLGSQLQEKATMVLEELVTNAVFHGFKQGGEDKYPRRENVTLEDMDKVEILVSGNKEGCLLKVSDTGGNLDFETVVSALHRCYDTGAEIQTKQSGAGLGLYMVFESVQHLKIVNTPGVSTAISCWIPQPRNEESKVFSFNFFKGVAP